eukprot:1068905-Pelagomonas_calceolata.AAC.4
MSPFPLTHTYTGGCKQSMKRQLHQAGISCSSQPDVHVCVHTHVCRGFGERGRTGKAIAE